MLSIPIVFSIYDLNSYFLLFVIVIDTHVHTLYNRCDGGVYIMYNTEYCIFYKYSLSLAIYS